MTTKVLALAVHNDDAEYGCGGILKLLAEAGCEVTVGSLTSRYHEADASGKQQTDSKALLGLASKVVKFVDAEDQLLFNEATIRAYREIIEEAKPDMAFIMWPRDNHMEHEQCAKAQLDAMCRYSNAAEVYAYEIGPQQTMCFFGDPDIYVNITDTMPALETLLGDYFPSGDRSLWQEKENSAALRGHMAYAGYTYAEALRIVKLPNGHDDFLLRTLLGDKFRWGGVGAYYIGRQYYM